MNALYTLKVTTPRHRTGPIIIYFNNQDAFDEARRWAIKEYGDDAVESEDPGYLLCSDAKTGIENIKFWAR